MPWSPLRLSSLRGGFWSAPAMDKVYVSHQSSQTEQGTNSLFPLKLEEEVGRTVNPMELKAISQEDLRESPMSWTLTSRLMRKSYMIIQMERTSS